MSTIAAARAAASAMFRAARIEPSEEDLELLAEDIEAMVAEEYSAIGFVPPLGHASDADFLRAASTLVKRIGGLKSLRAYTDCLTAGKEKQNG